MSKMQFAYMTIIAAAPETVWRHLTTPEFTRQYWHGTEIRSDFTAGAEIVFANTNGDTVVCGEILEADFPTRLVYSWRFTNMPDCADDAPSRVSFTLEALDVGTRLTIVHDELEEGSRTTELVSYGWPHVISGLKTLAETGEAVDFSRAEPVTASEPETATG